MTTRSPGLVPRRAVADEPSLSSADTELLIRNLLREGGFDQRLTTLETDFKHLPSKEFVTEAVDAGKKEVKEELKWYAWLLTFLGVAAVTSILSLLGIVVKLVFFNQPPATAP